MSNRECENGKCHYSVWKCIGWGVLGVIGFAIILMLLGLVTMTLWNWLIPGIFKLSTITFVQALGLVVLARLLFGGCGKGFHHMRHRHHGHYRHQGHHCGCGCESEKEKECCSDNDNKTE